MTSLRYRLFGVGKLPATYRELAAAPETLLTAEGVSIKVTTRDLRAPGRRVSRAVGLHSGAVVLTADRLVVTIGRSTAIDVPLNVAQPENTALRLTADAEGLHITVDIAAAMPGAIGTMVIQVRTAIPQEVLVTIPTDERTAALSTIEAQTLTRWC